MKAKHKSIPRVIACIVIAAFLCNICIYDVPTVFADGKETSAASAADAPAPSQDELIVIYENSETHDSAEAAEKAKDAAEGEIDVKAVDPVADSVGEDGACVLVTLDEGQDAEQAKKYLEEQDGVAHVQPNFRYRMMDEVELNDEYTEDLYHLNPWDSTHSSQCGANVTGAWELMGGIKNPDDFDNADVSIAVLDSGCQVTHEDLQAAVDMEHTYDAVRQEVGAEYAADQSGHGTHVAGIAAGVANNSKGVAGAAGNHARIIPVNVFTGQWARTADMLTAFSYLEELMDSGELTNLHVINMSLGGYGETDEDDEALKGYIRRMRDKDVLTVCAGGNGDEETGFAYKDNPCFPGDFEECLCVTSLDSDGTNSVFSDYSMDKDISAPGSFILSTMIDETGTIGEENDRKYGFLSGTSMASPLVAGIVALIWADNPELTADQVFESIVSTANEVNDAVCSHEGETGSAGAIDAGEAIKYAREHFDEHRVRLTDDNIEFEQAEFVYDGTAKIPSVTVRYNGKELTEGTDYILSHSENVNAGEAYVSVTGIKNYIGTIHKTYVIAPADISAAEISLDPAEFDFDGSYHFPSKVNVRMNGESLKWGRDFSVTALTDGIKAGAHKIQLDGKGNYGGLAIAEYVIKGEEEKEKPGDDTPAVDPSEGGSDSPGEGSSDDPSGSDSGKPSEGEQGGSSEGSDDKPSGGNQDDSSDASQGQTDADPQNGAGDNQGGSQSGDSSDGNANGSESQNENTNPPSGSSERPSEEQNNPVIDEPEAPWSNVQVVAAGARTVKGLKISVKGRRFTLKWKKTRGAGGYQIRYRVKGKKKWSTLKKTAKCKVRTKKLKKGKKYQFRVRTYNKVNGKIYYGKWTKIKVKKCR